MIRFHCPNCDVALSVQDTDAGKVAKCDRCDTLIQIPGKASPSRAGDKPVKARADKDFSYGGANFVIRHGVDLANVGYGSACMGCVFLIGVVGLWSLLAIPAIIGAWITSLATIDLLKMIRNIERNSRSF